MATHLMMPSTGENEAMGLDDPKKKMERRSQRDWRSNPTVVRLMGMERSETERSGTRRPKGRFSWSDPGQGSGTR